MRMAVDSTHHKEHLSLVVVWEKEQAGDGRVGDLVIKGFAVQLQELRVGLHVIAPSGRQALYLGEGGDCITDRLYDVSLC